MTASHIVAMGGGGFSEESDNVLLDDYILRLTGKEKPRICFVPTASGDAQGYIDKFTGAFPPERAEASAFVLFRRWPPYDHREYLLGQDVIYVGGGSTANLLAVWRLHGIDRILREAWQSGVILAGLSAGMICWFEGSITDSFGLQMAPLRDGLGFLAGSACPHYDVEFDRRPVYHRSILSGQLDGGYAADNCAGLVFRGTRLAEVVTSRREAKAYRVELVDGHVTETPLASRYLG